MILDVFSTVYLWIGMHANKTERNNCMAKVEKMIRAKTDGRDIDNVNYVRIDPCSEPVNFTTHFPEWEEEVSAQWLEPDPYTKRMLEIEAAKKKAAEEKWGNKEEVKYEEPPSQDNEGTFFSIDELKKGCPQGVNPAKKEQHLSPEDFQTVFGMDKDTFMKKKDWQRKDLKKAKGLF